jgi:hypothetical protein
LKISADGWVPGPLWGIYHSSWTLCTNFSLGLFEKMNQKKKQGLIIIPFQQLAMFWGGKRLYKSPCSGNFHGKNAALTS